MEELPKGKKEFWSAKRIARLAILIALSGVGALVKIPSPTGTVALDSAPGFFTAVAFGPVEGLIVAGIGHLFTALTAGFPMGILMHLYIALQMAAWAYLFWLSSKKINLITGIIVATVANGVLSSVLLIPFGGVGLFVAMLPSLLVGSLVNILVAAGAYKIISRSNLIEEENTVE